MKKIIILILLVLSGAAYGQLDSIKVSTPNSGLGDKIRVAFQKTNLAITQVNANTGNILLRLPISDTTLMLSKYAKIASPTFTGIVTIPLSFKIGAVTVSATGTQLNYLSSASGTTGTNTSNLVFSASPTFTGTVSGITSAMTGSLALIDSSATLGKKYATGLMLKNGLASKVNNADTLSMLSKYLLKTTAGSLYANQMIYPGAGIAVSNGTGEWAVSITDNSSNWNTAYGWGNHAGLYDGAGTASGLIGTHQSTYNHSNYNTAYTDRLKWDGGDAGIVASTGRTSLGGTTVGQALFTLINPSAITFPRINADNSVTALSAANFKTALSLTSSDVGLGNVTNESKATMFTSPTFTSSATLPANTSIGDVSSTEIGYINGLNGTAASRQNINDSLDVLKADAETGISEADSLLRTTGGYSTYNNHLNGIENSWVHKEFAAASGIKAFPVAPYYSFSTGGALTSGRGYYILYHVISTISVTGIKWANAIAGDYTAKDYNGFGLYSISGETYTLIDSTTNNGDLWKGTAFALQTTNWANGAHVLTPGYYIVAAVWSAESAPAAAPQPYYVANVGAVFHNLFRVNGLGGNHRMVAFKSNTTELPLSITATTAGMTAGTSIYAFLLY